MFLDKKLRIKIKNKLYCINAFIFFILFKFDYITEEWNKYGLNPVLGDNKTKTLFDPFVFKEDDLYKMYVSWRIKGAIAISTSKNGINWSELKIILSSGNVTSWEKIVNRASVVVYNKKYYLWYTGQTDTKSEIGVALSTDGYEFIKYKNNPILKPEYKFEKNSVMNPHVIYDKEEKIFKMWYSAGDKGEPDVICFAKSKDGINWVKYKNNPIFVPNKKKSSLDSYKIGGCDVHKISNNKYIMFYIGYTNIDTARIFFAESENGINNWKRSNAPIIKPSKGKFDNDACYKPSALYDNKIKKWILWYNGRVRGDEYIGMASYNKNQLFRNKFKSHFLYDLLYKIYLKLV